MAPHGYTTRDGWFIDPEGRRTLLRGINLGGSTKVPFSPDGSTHLGADLDGWAEVSFVGRPFPLADADTHLARLRRWGVNVLRLLVTWEAIEHAGPGDYDEEYLDYVRAVVERAGRHGLLVFIDPHHDVWSRWTGGDGAPFWTFELAGLVPEQFVPSGATQLDAHDWFNQSQRVPVATMWTLFLAGNHLCPPLHGVQTELQALYIDAISEVAERVGDLDNMLGYDTFNEPNSGYVGRTDLDQPPAFRRGGAGFSPLQYLVAADGNTVTNDEGEVLNPDARSIWEAGCPWRKAGVWDFDRTGAAVLLRPDYFARNDGQPTNAWRELVPFIRKFRTQIRSIDPDAMIFVEGNPMEPHTPWDDPDPLVVDARHWYDFRLLLTRKVELPGYRTFAGVETSTPQELADGYVEFLQGYRTINHDEMGGPPLLLGEVGIPFDLNAGAGLTTGDYSAHEYVLDATCRCLDELWIHATLWNYTANNTHGHGDGWNHEDFSVFSLDDEARADESVHPLDRGGRALDAWVRPSVRHAAGVPVEQDFDPATGEFTLVVAVDGTTDAPTLVFVPDRHYPGGPNVHLDGGTTTWDHDTQLLTWTHDGAGVHTLTLSRPTSL